MRIAILSSGDLSDMKGVMNFVHEKAKHMNDSKGAENVECDVYILRQVKTAAFTLLATHSFKKAFSYTIQDKTTVYDGVEYNNLWYKYGLLSNIVDTKYKHVPLNERVVARLSKRLKSYDIIASHTLTGHYLAYMTKKRYNVPYISTWHGSDVNVDPFKDKVAEAYTSEILHNADMNLFVSKALLKASEKLSAGSNKDVIYTGPSHIFKRATDDEIQRYRRDNNIDKSQIIIGFIGNLIPIKNVLVIPEILCKVQQKLDTNGGFVFWIAGNGKLQSQLEASLLQHNINYRFFGKLMPNEIPMFMSCLQILVLPSLNEGLPLVTLEAKKCGVNVVASNVGGIKECIGLENCFNLDDNFTEKISDRIVEMINTNEKATPIGNEFSWDAAIRKETDYYKQIIQTSSNGK